jgi:hypothetical protein
MPRHAAAAAAPQSIKGGEYPGFNLVVGDLKAGQVAYYSNKHEGGAVELPAGVHGGCHLAAGGWRRGASAQCA